MNVTFENLSKMLYVMRAIVESGQSIKTENETITAGYVAELLKNIEGK